MEIKHRDPLGTTGLSGYMERSLQMKDLIKENKEEPKDKIKLLQLGG